MLKELVYVDMHRPSRLFLGYTFFKKLKLQLRRGNDRKQLYLGKIKGQPLSPCFCPLPNMGRVWEGGEGGPQPEDTWLPQPALCVGVGKGWDV